MARERAVMGCKDDAYLGAVLPRVTFGIIVLNGEPFTRYCLRALYPFAHEIIVVEGACPAAAAIATADGHSTDGTLETLYRFKKEEDAQNKVHIVTRDGFWEEKDESSRAYAERATGDYLWQVDIDEFYHPIDMSAVCQILVAKPSISGMSFYWNNFWGGFDYLVDGWGYRDILRRINGNRRVFRWGKNYRYVSHRPPTVLDDGGQDLCSLNWISPDETARMGVFCYHYGMVFPKQAQQKAVYYQALWESCKDLDQWHRESYKELLHPFRILHGISAPSWLSRFNGAHPTQIRHLIDDLNRGLLNVEQRSTNDIEELISSARYRVSSLALGGLYHVVCPIKRTVKAFPGMLKRLCDASSRSFEKACTEWFGEGPIVVPGERLMRQCTKVLARTSELVRPDFVSALKEINQIASGTGLQQYTTYSRIWEYPWAWFQLEPLKQQGLRVLDIGSEISPFPWFLASQGFDVIISDTTANYWGVWQKVGRQLKLAVSKRTLDAQNLELPTASVDIYLSVSVIEHIPDKAKVIEETARVLQPGGLMVMTFDICEPELGMTFPGWNGQALTMRGFDELFRSSSWFESGLSEIPWNTGDIQAYLSWHRATAPHHNYVTGAAVVRRSKRVWPESVWKDRLRNLRGKSRTAFTVSKWHLHQGIRAFRRRVACSISEVVRRARDLFSPPMESLPDSPDLFHVYRALDNHPDLERKPGGWVYKGEFYPDYLTVGGASHAIFRQALEFCQGHGIDIGAGLWPLPGAIPVDVWRGVGTGKSITDFEDGSLEYVFSSHCLEHIEKWRDSLDEWVTKLKPGGILFLYLPHPDCAVWHPGSPFVGDGHKWIPMPKIIKQTLRELGCKIVQFDDGPDAMQSFYVCAQKQDGDPP